MDFSAVTNKSRDGTLDKRRFTDIYCSFFFLTNKTKYMSMDQKSGVECPNKQGNKKNHIGFEMQAPIRPQVDIKAIASICWHSTGLHMRGHP